MIPGLYALVDVDALEARRLDPVAVAEALVAGGAAVLQLRAKKLATRPMLSLAEKIVAVARDVPFYVNDRLDVALAVGAGVHLGQDDLPVEHVRRIAPATPVGISTHDLAQLERAVSERPTYVAYGPVYGTSSKENPDPVVGLEGVRRAAELAGDVPLVAIGGITVERAAEVVSAGATWIAVIAGLLPAASETLSHEAALSTVTERARAYDHASRTR